MRQRLFLLVLSLSGVLTAIACIASGCGNSITEGPPSGSGAGGAGGETSSDGQTTGVGGHKHDAGKDALSEYNDPGCPDAGPPIYDYQCDPYNQLNGDCPGGQACYIYVDYPTEPCGQETYGSLCADAGFGQQGDPCGSPLDCGAGLVCVVTQAGTQCATLCPLDGPNTCPAGLVCDAIDVEGFGGCF